MRYVIYFSLLITSHLVHADTIEHFMNIAGNIPQMEMKADQESQAWARSARNILVLTSESIMESLMLINTQAQSRGSALFCMPANTQISAEEANSLIQQSYKENPAPENEKSKMTVSQVALMGLMKRFPCSPVQSSNAVQSPSINPAQPANNFGMQHVGAAG